MLVTQDPIRTSPITGQPIAWRRRHPTEFLRPNPVPGEGQPKRLGTGLSASRLWPAIWRRRFEHIAGKGEIRSRLLNGIIVMNLSTHLGISTARVVARFN
jgi:hypothetical protein